MYSQLKYWEGAKPGLKRKSDISDQQAQKKKEKSKADEAKRVRPLVESWKNGRPWLVFNYDSQSMTCSLCIDVYGKNKTGNANLKHQHTFLTGCTNRRISAVIDHETCKGHEEAVQRTAAKNSSDKEKKESSAGKALNMLTQSERHRLAYLFRNAHAVAKQNRPLTDYLWLCDIDKAKGLDIGETYRNEKAALIFLNCISETEKEKSTTLLEQARFFSFLMDGSTDISGDEQEAIYVRVANKGCVTERFLHIGTPTSTRSRDLLEFVTSTFDTLQIDKGKLIGIGSDGASNMTGHKSGLSALLKQEIGPEIVSVHCLAHRLELAFRDIVKTSKLYDKLMTLLIGLHYFYIKQYKNKSGLLRAIEAVGNKGVLPPKVTGTRWLPHMYRGISSMLRTFRAYEVHLSTISHENPKAEGLVKIMKNKSLMAFVLFLQEVLDPLMKLSLKLQKASNTLAESLFWIETTVELLKQCKTRNSEQLSDLLESGQYQGISLSGQSPSMNYKDNMIDGFCEAITKRFQLAERPVVNATRILNFKNWPSADSIELQDFGVDDVKAVSHQYSQTLEKHEFSEEEALNEWRLMKIVFHKRHGAKLAGKTWADDEVYDDGGDFKNINMIVDLLLTLPPTSVSCETTFSQMKLIKTSRRTRLRNATLNSLLLVKLESAPVGAFDPEVAIDRWMASGAQGRRTNYKRKQRKASEVEVIDLVTDEQPSTSTAGIETTEALNMDDLQSEPEEPLAQEEEIELDVEFLNSICHDDDDFCLDFQDEESNLLTIMNFSRSS